jgi:branched-chain amino acid transport system permease protein
VDWEQVFRGASNAAIGPDAIYLALAAIGLNVQFGYTGLLNFGQVGFLTVGAYSVAVSVDTFGWSLWAGLFVGVLAAVVLALLLGFPTLRLRGDYLAIVTIAASEILRLVARSNSFRETFGGSDGLQNFGDDFFDLNPYSPGRYGFWAFRFGANDMWVVTVGWILVALFCLLVFLLMRSPWGRVVKAIREDEDAVRSLGKNVYAYKMQALVLGGVIGAFGGFMFALKNQSVQPDNFSTNITFFAYAALILGGAARVAAPVVGAMIFWFVIRFTDEFIAGGDRAGWFDLGSTERGAVRLMLVGLGLALLMVFRPQGIFGDKNEVAVSARG